MSTKAASPTANLLRNSRFFSIPRPLPLPISEAQQFQRNVRNSDSATLPYPVLQAISTSPKAHSQGDWGLKRPLPTRVTQRTSTPILRINGVDTREALTDYSSAADHTITLQKIHELNLPVVVPASRLGKGTKARPLDPFQPAFDNTDPQAPAPGPTTKRWKFTGPSLARISQGNFNTYVAKEIKKRKVEFSAFLRQRARQHLLAEHRSLARTTGRDLPSDEDSASEVTEQDVESRLRQWQADTFASGTMLHILIAEFLDLPDSSSPVSLNDPYHRSQDDNPAPSHPSAGLSYLRSDAFLSNHPVLGPQANQPPVEARILGRAIQVDPPIVTGSSTERIGVAGIVAPAPRASYSGRIYSTDNLADDPMGLAKPKEASHSIGVNTPGGNRIWVAPSKLEIDSNGRPALAAQNASPIAVNVHTGRVSAIPSTPRVAPPQIHGDARSILKRGKAKTRASTTSSPDITTEYIRNLFGQPRGD